MNEDQKVIEQQNGLEAAGDAALEKLARATITPLLATMAEQETILRFFVFAHLPEKLQGVSFAFASLAVQVMELPRSAERTVALRKLLESKDAAVRAAL
jgi:hypothetical protein